jgi:GNAT superfamily N-acetyltransferase
LSDCCESLFDSELGRRYFNSIIQVETFIRYGLERGEIIHVINNKEDFLGFGWVVERGAFCSYPYIQAIAVKRAYRSIGAGSFLLSHIEQTCFSRSTCIFTLSSSASPKLLRFFHRHGYKQVGKIPQLCLPDLDELLLMKTNNGSFS